MQKDNVNYKAINDVYKNAHIALQSIKDILPSVKHKQLRAELREQNKGYESFIKELNVYMQKNAIEPKDINFMKKAMLWSSIKMKTMMNNSRNQIAEMMINGTVMGTNELRAMKNECKNFNEEVCAFIEKLLNLEEEYHERLKKYL